MLIGESAVLIDRSVVSVPPISRGPIFE